MKKGYPGSATAIVVLKTPKDVVTAVRHVACGRPVALLLPEQVTPAENLPARPLRAASRGLAKDLIRSMPSLKGESFLDKAASLLGVACWPAAIRHNSTESRLA
jgi:hypothetical protein